MAFQHSVGAKYNTIAIDDSECSPEIETTGVGCENIQPFQRGEIMTLHANGSDISDLEVGATGHLKNLECYNATVPTTNDVTTPGKHNEVSVIIQNPFVVTEDIPGTSTALATGHLEILSPPLPCEDSAMTKLQKGKRYDTVIIKLKTREIVTSSNRHWFADFGRFTPQEGVDPSERVTKKFAGAIKKLRERVCKVGVWETIAAAIASIYAFLEFQPIRKDSFRRPKNLRIEILFTTDSESSSDHYVLDSPRWNPACDPRLTPTIPFAVPLIEHVSGSPPIRSQVCFDLPDLYELYNSVKRPPIQDEGQGSIENVEKRPSISLQGDSKIDEIQSEDTTNDAKGVANTVEACNLDASGLRRSSLESKPKKRQWKRKQTIGLTSPDSQSVSSDCYKKLVNHRKQARKSDEVLCATTIDGLNSTVYKIGCSQPRVDPTESDYPILHIVTSEVADHKALVVLHPGDQFESRISATESSTTSPLLVVPANCDLAPKTPFMLTETWSSIIGLNSSTEEPEIQDERRGSIENVGKPTCIPLQGDSASPSVKNETSLTVNEANSNVIRKRVDAKINLPVSTGDINSLLNAVIMNFSKTVVDKTQSEDAINDAIKGFVNTLETCNLDSSGSLRPSSLESKAKKRQWKRKQTSGLTNQDSQKSKKLSVSPSVVTNSSQKLTSHRKQPRKSFVTATTINSLNDTNICKPLDDSEEQMHPRLAIITREHEPLTVPKSADQLRISRVNKLDDTSVRTVSPDITSQPVTRKCKPQKVFKPDTPLVFNIPESTKISPNGNSKNSNETKQQGDSIAVPKPAITEVSKFNDRAALKAEPKNIDSEESFIKSDSQHCPKTKNTKWYPNIVDQQKLYQEKMHFVEIDNINKPPVDTHVWRMIDVTDVVLQKFIPIDMNGRVFHKATSQLQVLQKKDRAFFIKYQPVIAVIVHDTDVVKIIQYFNVDRVQPYLEKMLNTPSLFWPFKIVIQAIITEFLTWPPGFIESRVSAGSEKCSEYFKSAWDIIESAISGRVKELSTETKLVPGLVAPFLNHPFIKFSKIGKEFDKSCMGCTSRQRKAAYRVEFHGKPYDKYSFDDLPGDHAPPESSFFCTSCTPYFRTIDKLLNHKWCLYRAFRNRITDYIGELGPDQSMERDNLIQVILKDHEYIFQCFVELQMQLAEADNHIEKLKNVN